MHRPPHHAYAADTTSEMILAWAERIGSSTKRFIEINFEERRYYASRLKSAINLRKDVLKNNWQIKLEAACQYALSINCFTFQRLLSILNKQLIPNVTAPPKTIVHNDNLRGA